MDYQSENNHVIVNCGQRLSLDTIQNQKEILIKVLAINKPIIFRVSEVTNVDTAALQLLLSFVLRLSSQDIKWEWEEPSFALIHVANLLGIQTLLKLPEK